MYSDTVWEATGTLGAVFQAGLERARGDVTKGTGSEEDKDTLSSPSGSTGKKKKEARWEVEEGP
jgi:hypothetical protein